MSYKKERQLTFFKKVCLAVINTALFAPVLQLFMQLNDLTSSRALLFYLPFLQLVFILLPKWYLWLPVQLLVSSFVVYSHFPLQETIGLSWLRTFGNELAAPIRQLFSEETTLFPNILSLLLFVVIVFIASWCLLSFYNPYVSFFSTLGYLLILQVFTTTELFQTVVSTLLFGSLLIGLANIPVTGSLKNALLSLVVLSAAGLLLVRAAIWGVRQFTEQQAWTISQTDSYHESLESNGFFEWIENHSPGGTSVRSGFSENDSNLGGPLTQRYNTVFQAHTSVPQYWFIEAKEIYTGKGWETRAEERIDIDLSIYEAFAAEASEIETTEIPIELNESFSYLPYAYQTIGFDFHEQTDQVNFQLELPTEQYLLAGEHDTVQGYTLVTAPREFNPSSAQSSYTEENMGGESYNTYTQVPEELPQRVINLAHSITNGLNTQYEKVMAIENYLKSEGGFQYSVSQTPFVPVDRDYVDFFLFDSKIGYCDNFSTAMVVLCRSVGIPTRWAKGFNSGEEVRNGEETYYEITNANAHSWPEVYFGEAGWIPFEPTPPFSQPLTDGTALEEDMEDAITPEEESQSLESSAAESAESSLPSESETAESETAAEAENTSWIQRNLGVLVLSLFLTGLVILAFLKRWPLLIWTTKKLLQSDVLTKEQHITIVNHLFKWKQKPLPSQTIRQYFEQWILLVPEKEAAIQSYIQLMEELRYAPPSNKDENQWPQKKILLEMVEVIELSHQEIKKSVSE